MIILNKIVINGKVITPKSLANKSELYQERLEVKRELAELRKLRAELEAYKMKYIVDVQDQASKKIKEVVDNISNLFDNRPLR